MLSLFAFLTLTVTQVQWAYGLLVFLMGFMDGVDGSLARRTGQSTAYGALADSVIDKVTEIVILLAIPLTYRDAELLGLPLHLWTTLCISGWLLTSYVRSCAERLGAHDLDIGLGARSERLFILVIAAILGCVEVGVGLTAIISMLTAAYRYHHYGQEIRHAERDGSQQ